MEAKNTILFQDAITSKTSLINWENKEILIRDLYVKEVPVIQPLRLRIPKSGMEKNMAESIEEILKEQARPLTVKELFEEFERKGREMSNLKDFSSQLNNIGKAKNKFHKDKINNRNLWGLSEWRNGTGKGFNLVLARIKK